MAQYWLEVTEHTDLSQFTRIYSSSQTDNTAVIDDDGVWAIRFVHAGPGGAVAALIWDEIPSSSDCEVMVLFRRDITFTTQFDGPAARLNTDVDGYFSGARGDSGLSLRRIDDFAHTVLGTTNAGVVSDVTSYHWQKIGVSGTTIRHKAWDGDVDDEPPIWEREVTDATYESGLVGAFATGMTDTRPQYIRIISVGTNGDPAPTGPVEEGVVLSNAFADQITATSIRPNVTITF